MEISKPTREERIEYLTMTNFEVQSLDLDEAIHDTKVGLWKVTNEIIEEELEHLKLAKVRLKAKIHELNNFIK